VELFAKVTKEQIEFQKWQLAENDRLQKEQEKFVAERMALMATMTDEEWEEFLRAEAVENAKARYKAIRIEIKEKMMVDSMNLFFSGGLTIRLPINDMACRKASQRIMRRLARANRLQFTGAGIAIPNQRAFRRANGASIIEGQPVSKRVQKSLIASGLSKTQASEIRWVSIW
jgi:hypothetical protein